MPCCVRCDTERPASGFRPHNKICRICQHLAVLPRRLRAQRFVAKVRARVPCAGCKNVGRIEWHNEAHVENPSMRVANLARNGYALSRIKAEMRASMPVCRRCHMKTDGRSAALTQNKPRYKGRRFPPRPCVMCSSPSKPLRRGLCARCYERLRGRRRRASRTHGTIQVRPEVIRDAP